MDNPDQIINYLMSQKRDISIDPTLKIIHIRQGALGIKLLGMADDLIQFGYKIHFIDSQRFNQVYRRR